jgi:L-asparaginase
MTTKLTVLATGGTIAGIAGSAIAHDYRSGEIGIEDYLEKVGGLGLEAELSGTQIANIDSADIGPAVWQALHAAAMAALSNPECDGIIVTHGTDTLEETAFLLDLTLPGNKPVVVVGAMRPADAVGYDGLRNFANAVRVASDPDAAGRGVLVVMGDRVFGARDVYKVRTRGTEAFRGFPRESVGLVTPASLEWFGAPWRSGTDAAFAWSDELPEVMILYAHAGLDAAAVSRQLAEGTRGIVVAGVGEGNRNWHGWPRAASAWSGRAGPTKGWSIASPRMPAMASLPRVRSTRKRRASCCNCCWPLAKAIPPPSSAPSTGVKAPSS